MQNDGYKMHRWGGTAAFPVCITVFSAPNYCGNHGNKGAVIMLENGKMGIKQYRDVDAPYHLPNNIDLFQWSMPYLISKVQEIITQANKRAIAVDKTRGKEMSKQDFHKMFQDEIMEKYGDHDFAHHRNWREMRAKMLSWARFLRIFKIIRENKEEIQVIKQRCPDGKLPHGSLIGGRFHLHGNHVNFYVKKHIDQRQNNEGFPIASPKLSEKTKSKLNSTN